MMPSPDQIENIIAQLRQAQKEHEQLSLHLVEALNIELARLRKLNEHYANTLSRLNEPPAETGFDRFNAMNAGMGDVPGGVNMQPLPGRPSWG